MTKHEISVIVPVYNVNNYLAPCVDSILNQTFTAFECILVDDGATDGSGVLCDALAQKDDRIRVIHRENGGLSAARNSGLDIAAGEYISFIDSDDLIGPHFLEELYSGIRDTGAQIAACGYLLFPDGEATGEERCTGKTEVWSRDQALSELAQSGMERRAEFVAIMCNKLFSRELFSLLRFPEGKLHEDEFLIHHLLIQADTFCRCDADLYFYRQRNSSITSAETKLDLRHLQALDAFMERCELLKGRTEQWVYRKNVSRYFEMMIHFYYTLAKPAGCGREVHLRFLRELGRFGRDMQIKRYYLFALSPAAYRKIFWQK